MTIVASDSGRLLATLPHPAGSSHIVWNPRRPNILAVACKDYAIHLWDVDAARQTGYPPGDLLRH